MLSDAAKAARRAYKREWARRNPDKVREQQERHWEKLAAQQHQEAQDVQDEQSGADGH